MRCARGCRSLLGPNAARGQGYATVKTNSRCSAVRRRYGQSWRMDSSKYVFIWEKVDGKWKLDSDIWNLNK
jgi:hypothetical protein